MLANLAERVDRDRFEIQVATFAVPGPVAHRLRVANIATYSLGGRGLLVAAARLASLLHRRSFDAVVAYGFKTTMIARLLVRLTASGAAFISGVRGLHVTDVEDVASFKSRVLLAVERITSPLVSVYDANSPGAVELLAAAGIKRSRLHYIPNGIDVSAWSATDDDADNDVPLILCVARFSRLKRHVDLLQALAHVRDEGVSFRALFVGDGPTYERSAGLARELGLANVVELCGQLPNAHVKELMTRADVFCLPSLWEGMPGSVMEAMAMGLPVVATDVNGVKDLVVEGETGLLVPPKRPELLAAALHSLLVDRNQARSMGTAGRRRIECCFTLERMVRAKEELYSAIADLR
jgi:glycosyltransferase involved in cell wall biosynthesis